jgi:hypothetical protein
MRNVAPPPGAPSAETVPPWASATAVTIERPSPTPPLERARSSPPARRASTLFSTASFAVRKRIADLKPCSRSLDVRQHPVEHDQVGLRAADGSERLASGRRLVDLEAS